MMKKNDLLLYFLTLCMVCLIGWTVYREVTNSRIAYIDIEKLADGYKLKKDLEKDAGKNLYAIQHAIDSLELLRKTINSPGPTLVDSQITKAKYVYQEYYNTSVQQMNKHIWERLNPVIEQYGKEKKIQLLIGANGNGSLLYADKGRDMTEDLINYINKKYEKGS